jgi:NADPH2:quinone reductase
MQAMVIEQFGDPNVFQSRIMPKPTLKSGHVLIKTVATSVNPFDCKLRKGHYANLVPHCPMLLHGDVASVLEK